MENRPMNATNPNALDQIVSLFGNGAVRACGRFLRQRGIDPLAHVDAISAEVKARLEGAISEILKDGREALDAGMVDAALATMAASSSLVGIDAGKAIASRLPRPRPTAASSSHNYDGQY
jgi:hypothetical protein